MSVIKVTKADLVHVARLMSFVEWVYDDQPELLTSADVDELLIVRQWLKEKLNEDTDV
jgi:hypothetical protein